jgi:hypothetical protein
MIRRSHRVVRIRVDHVARRDVNRLCERSARGASCEQCSATLEFLRSAVAEPGGSSHSPITCRSRTAGIHARGVCRQPGGALADISRRRGRASIMCTNRHSISQTASDEIAIGRRGDYVPGVCAIVKPCAFGAPLRGCGT